MGALDGKIAIVTGAGRGIGREHALALAGAGAKVVVNDLGGSAAGEGQDSAPAQQVADEIKERGGAAAANFDNVADFQGAENLIKQAVGEFGRLDVLVNNAGIIRDRMLVNLSEDEWDSVINVHLKGHFAPTRHAAAYWRQESKAGNPVAGRVINTSSPSGVFGNVGQTNYGAAKAGIAAFTIIAALELGRYGVTVNCLAPNARTRLTEQTFGDIPVPEGRVRRDGPVEHLPDHRRSGERRGGQHHRTVFLRLRWGRKRAEAVGHRHQSDERFALGAGGVRGQTERSSSGRNTAGGHDSDDDQGRRRSGVTTWLTC